MSVNVAEGNASPVERVFHAHLTQEILSSLRLRAAVVAGIFAGGTGILLGAAIVFGIHYLPTRALPVAMGLVVYELWLRKVYGDRIVQQRPCSHLLLYGNAFVEVTLISLILLRVVPGFVDPRYALSAPPVLIYAAFMILSTFHLDFRLSWFVGAVSAVEYWLLSFYCFSIAPAHSAMDPIFTSPFAYLAKGGMLMGLGVGSAFVARELRRRVIRTHQSLQERDREEAANRAKSTFLANMSHEIRTPLNAILGYAQLLEADSSLADSQRQALRTILRSGDHLLHVVNDVLDLSKIEAGREELQKTEFSLQALIEDLNSMFGLRCRQKDLAWSVEIEAGGRPVRGDEAKLRQVLVNLLGNAVKYTDAGFVSLTLRRTADHVRFEVSDTGPGIPPGKQAAIFEPFQQDEAGHLKGGTGLGLAISHRHVALMGGRLEVQSAPGQGTAFAFSIPLPETEGASGAVPTHGADALASRLEAGTTVDALVVDDVEENRNLLKQILQRAGAGVRVAGSGVEALASIEAAVPDIVFLDIRMPEMTGIEVLDRLASDGRRNDMRVVAVSASVLRHQKEAYLDHGFDGFLDKPLQIDQVHACLSRLLGARFEAAATTETEGLEPQGAPRVPPELLAGLLEAARGSNVTLLRQRMDELGALGPAGQSLAASLRTAIRQYDMDAAVALLQSVSHD